MQANQYVLENIRIMQSPRQEGSEIIIGAFYMLFFIW